MAITLQPSIEVIEVSDALSFDIHDTTLAFNAAYNTVGYGGADNPNISDVTVATIEIRRVGYTNIITLDVFPDLPTLDFNKSYNITNVMMGLLITDKIPDGVYEITYTISGTYSSEPFEIMSDCNFLFSAQADACLSSRLSAIDIDANCGCDNEDLSTALDVATVIASAEYAACCGKSNRAKLLIEFANEKCDDVTCKTC